MSEEIRWIKIRETIRRIARAHSNPRVDKRTSEGRYTCDGCGTLIRAGDDELSITDSEGGAHLDVRCHAIWVRERNRLPI